MAWSARRNGMILEVADVPDDVAVYLNTRADSEGKSVDAVACDLLKSALAGARPAECACSRPTPGVVYGVAVAGDHYIIRSAEIKKVTEKNVIVTTAMPGYGKHIKRIRWDGRPETIGFTQAEAVQRYLDRQREWLEEARARQPYGEWWTPEKVARNISYHEACVASLERLLAKVSDGAPPST